jgi:hypothetical protein
VSFFEHRVPELLDEIVRMYRSGGRLLAQLTDGDLDAHFVDILEAYIADPRTPARFRAVNDVAAEYVLRRCAAPIGDSALVREVETINRRDKVGIVVAIPGFEKHLPEVVLAFGRFGTIPAAGVIFTISDEDHPPNWDKLTGPELQLANKRWRKERDERHAEFEWLLLGRLEARGAPVVSLDDARAYRVSA